MARFQTVGRFGLFIVVGLTLGVSAQAEEPDNALQERIALGRLIAEENCSTCHAIGPTGASHNPLSPPFRTLSQDYPIDSLQEALAEGISVGHSEMPVFQFRPFESDALIDYLKSIQRPVRPDAGKH